MQSGVSKDRIRNTIWEKENPCQSRVVDLLRCQQPGFLAGERGPWRWGPAAAYLAGRRSNRLLVPLSLLLLRSLLVLLFLTAQRWSPHACPFMPSIHHHFFHLSILHCGKKVQIRGVCQTCFIYGVPILYALHVIIRGHSLLCTHKDSGCGFR